MVTKKTTLKVYFIKHKTAGLMRLFGKHACNAANYSSTFVIVNTHYEQKISI